MRGGPTALLVAVVASSACHRTASPVGDAPSADAGVVASLDASVASRCTLDDAGVTLGDVGDRKVVVIGSAVPTNDGFAVGLVHSPSSGAEAMIARVVGHTVTEQWVLARRAELVADAPPPIPLLGPGILYGAYLTRDADAGISRRIALKKFGVAAPVASFKEQTADSMSFDAAISADVARVALAWDDDGPKDGGIRVAIVPLVAGSPGAPRVVSDGVTDVDAPRLVARPTGGWWVAWTARREELADAGPRIEVPGEAPAFSWIELVALDPGGAPAGPIRKLTSPTGHLASFDLAARPHGELDVFVRDETQTREGEGGPVSHIVVSDASVSDPMLLASGAGRGAIDLVTGAAGEAWLAFSDAQDRPRVLPLGESRAPLGPPTVEDSLEGARLLSISSTTGAVLRFVAAVPTFDAALFRDVDCRR